MGHESREAEISASLEVEHRLIETVKERTGIELPRLAAGEMVLGAGRLAILEAIRPQFSSVSDDAVRSVMYGLFRGRRSKGEIDFLIESLDRENGPNGCRSLSTLLVEAVRPSNFKRIVLCLSRNLRKLELAGLKCLLKHLNEVDEVREALAEGLALGLVDPESVLCLANYTPRLYFELVSCDRSPDGTGLPRNTEELLGRFSVEQATGRYTLRGAATVAVYGKTRRERRH